MPVLDLGKCNYCGLCVSVCYYNVLVVIDEVLTVVETERCDWCTDCEAVCPTGAISCPFDIVIENPVR
jgi:MinD superfamily P-loop ATPase